MNKQFEIIKRTRKSLISYTNDLTIEQLNKIPPGFNNNIAWNLGHLISSQHGLCYVRAGLPIFVDKKIFETYNPGTKPGANIDDQELEIIKQLLLSSIDKFETDYYNNIFVNYTPWTNRYGIRISTIDEVIEYVIFHEGLHFGYIMALKNLVK